MVGEVAHARTCRIPCVAIASQLWCENWKRTVRKSARGATSAGTSGAKRRKVKHDTYQKWLKQYDRECQTVTWLDCETSIDGGVKLMTKLKCRVCTKYRDRILGQKNFSDKWISGADSVRTTNVVDQAKSDQHVHTMNLLRKEQAQPQGASVASYAPIAQSLNTLSEDERRMLRTKFDITYFVATEHFAYLKYPKSASWRQGME